MSRKFTSIAFTAAVRAAQRDRGSRDLYARFEQSGPDSDRITADIADFIAQRDGAYLGTVSASGYPYIQFRGGPPGFLQVLDDKILGFADFKGNLQYISVGNLSENDKAFLFLMDYRHRRRLKLWGRARFLEADSAGSSELLKRLSPPDYPAEVERAIVFEVEAWNWNCPQHIPVRYSEAEVAALQARIVELEQKLAEQ